MMAGFFVVMGPPGAGTSTQAFQLAAALRIAYVSVGNLYPHRRRDSTALELLFQRYIKEGTSVPDDVVSQILNERLAQQDCSSGAVFDWSPQNSAQVKMLDDALSELGATVYMVLSLKVSYEEFVRRLRQRVALLGRADDTAEAIATRLHVYDQQTASVLEAYAQRGVLRTIDGDPSIKPVWQMIFKTVTVMGA